MKLTPRIVIESKVINRCFDCPFFESRAGGYDDEHMYCRHPDSQDGWELMNEYGFKTLPDAEIWVKCPLPEKPK